LENIQKEKTSPFKCLEPKWCEAPTIILTNLNPMKRKISGSKAGTRSVFIWR